MLEKDTSSIKKEVEKAIVVGLITSKQDKTRMTEYLDELEFLALTAGAEVQKRFTQSLDKPDRRTYVASGKLEEIANFVMCEEIDMVIFDDELSPSQFRNIEEAVGVKVIDRTNLILDIFATRAQTSHARTQVELAQYQYLLPRLVGMWTHLERQRGGIGMKGPGETEIETDRRIVRDKISKLKEKLTKIDKQKQTQRGNRGAMVRVALVGYTNVGKSTIMNMLTKADILAENKLFATLDTTVRKVVIDNLPFLLSDTVGFIRKLPTHLVESFKSTLDEVREADILIHVIDISHPDYEEQINTVEETINDIDSSDKPNFFLFNKIDNFKFVKKDEFDLTPMEKENYSLEDLKEMWLAKQKNSIFISATEKENIDEFKSILYEKVKEIHKKRFPYNNYLFNNYNQEGEVDNN